MTYQEFEATAVGLASRPARPWAALHLERLRVLLANDRLQTLLGDRLPTAERLVTALQARHPRRVGAAIAPAAPEKGRCRYRARGTREG